MSQLVLAAVVCSFLVSPAQQRQTDREVDRLKGAVKSVVTEVANYKLVAGESVEEGRVLSSSVTYDAYGNWVQRKDYDDKGKLMRSLLFSFIGKNRVATAEEGENRNALVFIKPLPRGRGADPRYTYKFRYRYDVNGKRIEEVYYHSDGSFYLRYTYNLKGNRKVVSVYTADGELNQKLEYTLDNKGNETEVLLSESFTADKITYRYIEFDPQGNWTKRVITKGFKELEERLFSMIRPWSIEYRKFTYH